MKLKTTKTLANTLNKYSKFTIRQIKLDESEFSWFVDIDTYKHENDYNYYTGEYSVFVVDYPVEYYANSRYITTNDLIYIYNKTNHTLEHFIKAFNEYIEI